MIHHTFHREVIFHQDPNATKMLRYWAESCSGVHCVVFKSSQFDSLTVRKSSMVATPDISDTLMEMCRASTCTIHGFKVSFGDGISSAVSSRMDPSRVMSCVNKVNQQSMETVIVRNMCRIGWNWVKTVDYDTNLVQLHGRGNCPLDPVLTVVFSSVDDGAVQLRVTTNCFWSRDHTCGGDDALVRIKDEYVRCYAKYSPFLQQVEDLRRCALIIQESEYSPVAEPNLPVDLFHPKAVVMKVLLVCRRGLSVSANLAIRGGSEGSVLICECKDVDALEGPHRSFYTNLWLANMHRWSNTASLVQNIEIIFDVDLSAARMDYNRERPISRDAHTLAECAICYCSQSTTEKESEEPSAKKRRRDDDTPVHDSSISSDEHITCLNQQCDKMFHRECAKNWLLSLSDVKKSFGVLFGTCPYCSNVLEVRE